jgi:hypothetical protein
MTVLALFENYSTKTKAMKKKSLLLGVSFITLFLLVFGNVLNAQENKEKEKEVRVKIIKEENGEKIMIDTVYVMSGSDEGLFDIIEEVSEDGKMKKVTVKVTTDGYESEDGEVKVWTTYDDDGNKKTLKIEGVDGEHEVIDMFIGECDSLEEAKEIKVITTSSGSNTMMLITKDGERKEVVLEGDAVYEYKTDDGETVIIKTVEDGEQIFITTDVELEEGEEKSITKKIMIVKAESDDESEMVMTVVMQSLDGAEEENLKNWGAESESDDLELEHFHFYPNPTDGKISLEFESDESGDLKIMIFDSAGKTIFKEKVKSFTGKYEKEIDLTGEPDGAYFLNITLGKKSISRKIIVN